MLTKEEIFALQTFAANKLEKKSAEKKRHIGYGTEHGPQEDDLDFLRGASTLLDGMHKNFDKVSTNLTEDNWEKLKQIKSILELMKTEGARNATYTTLLLATMIGFGTGPGFLVAGADMLFGTWPLITGSILLTIGILTLSILAANAAYERYVYRDEPATMEALFSGRFDKANVLVKEVELRVQNAIEKKLADVTPASSAPSDPFKLEPVYTSCFVQQSTFSTESRVGYIPPAIQADEPVGYIPPAIQTDERVPVINIGNNK